MILFFFYVARKCQKVSCNTSIDDKLNVYYILILKNAYIQMVNTYLNKYNISNKYLGTTFLFLTVKFKTIFCNDFMIIQNSTITYVAIFSCTHLRSCSSLIFFSCRNLLLMWWLLMSYVLVELWSYLNICIYM